MKKVRLLQCWLGKPDAKIGDIIEVSDEVAEDLITRGGKRGPIAEKIEAEVSDKEEDISAPNKHLSQMPSLGLIYPGRKTKESASP